MPKSRSRLPRHEVPARRARAACARDAVVLEALVGRAPVSSVDSGHEEPGVRVRLPGPAGTPGGAIADVSAELSATDEPASEGRHLPPWRQGPAVAGEALEPAPGTFKDVPRPQRRAEIWCTR